MKLMMIGAVQLLQLMQMSSAANILILGDSMGSYMGRTLENICPGSTVQNAAIGGTTADQWAAYDTDVLDGCSTTIDYDVVYMSYGGNDLIGSGCSITAAALATNIENAIENTRNTLYPTATTYVLAGYCQVYQNVDCPGGASDFSALDDALTSLASTYANTNVKIFNHMTVCGGTSSSYSDGSYFQDAIHLNAKGYCTYFTQSDIATELQCGSQASIDCNSNPPSLCGIGDGNCAEDTPACPSLEATTTSTPLTPTTTSAPSTPTTTSAPSNPSPSPSPSPSGDDSDNDGDDSDNSSSSDSDSTILFIGVGVGAVIGIVVLAAVLYSCVGRSRK